MTQEHLSYEEASRREKRLRELCEYDLCEGKLLTLDKDQASSFGEKVFNRFNFYKSLIQTGEYSYDELVDFIVNKHALKSMIDKKFDITTDEGISYLFSQSEKNVLEKENLESDIEKIKSLYNTSISSIVNPSLHTIPVIDIDKKFHKKNSNPS